MLKEAEVEFTYREYTKEPLSADEIREVLGKLGMGVKDVLRARDAKKAGCNTSDSSMFSTKHNLSIITTQRSRLSFRQI